MEAHIWKSKPNSKFNPDDLRLPAEPKGKRVPIADIDVTFADLKDPSAKASLFPIIEFLRAFWVGDNKDRETNCRIGTMYVYFDEDGAMHMDFATRFTLPKDSQGKMLKALRKYWRNQ